MPEFAGTDRLFVEFETAEGAVLRMMGLVERRGFRIRRVAMAEQPNGRTGSLALVIVPHDGNRSIEVLTRQLERLHGVRSVSRDAAMVRAA